MRKVHVEPKIKRMVIYYGEHGLQVDKLHLQWYGVFERWIALFDAMVETLGELEARTNTGRTAFEERVTGT